MYVSVKTMSKVRETLHQPSITFFFVCGWCQFILSPCSGWPSQHIQNCAFQASNICARSKSRRDLGTCQSAKVKGDQDHPPNPVTGFLVGWE